MKTFSIHFEDGREYVVNGDTPLLAVRNNLKCIEKALTGCAVADVSVEEKNRCEYILKIRYYDRTLSQIKRLRKRPQPICAELFMKMIAD